MAETTASLIKPFRGLLPRPEYAQQVAAPPYDVLSSSEARVMAAGNPWSFLHISKPEIDLAEDVNAYSDEVYKQASLNLKKMIQQKILQRQEQSCYFHYRLEMGQHTQDGLVAVASVDEYLNNRIRKHELTRPEKENDRVRQISAVNAQTGPVMMVYPQSPRIDQLLSSAAQLPVLFQVSTADDVRHIIRVIDQQDLIDSISKEFDSVPAIYIADGHHRSAAAERVASARHSANQATTSSEYFLSVLFPHHQQRIIDYNRVVSDLNQLSQEEFLVKISAAYSVKTSAEVVKPKQTGEVGMYLTGQWYHLVIKPELVNPDNLLGSLDVSLLSDYILTPILGIKDLRHDQRIDFVGGSRSSDWLQGLVDSGKMAVAFVLYPTQMQQLMGVADSGQIMPPKSTWFEPKLADGLVSHVLD